MVVFAIASVSHCSTALASSFKKKVPAAALLQQIKECHALVGHRVHLQ
jgi:hypothetical protein